MKQSLNIDTVAVIGAGVSGVSAGIHLRGAGLKVTVFERTSRVGGIWVFDKLRSTEAPYPSVAPSLGESPEFEEIARSTQVAQYLNGTPSEFRLDEVPGQSPEEVMLAFAPPGPCYVSLKNNVSTIEMELSNQRWKDGTGEFVPHHILADYIQDSALANGIQDSIRFNTRVNRVSKWNDSWEVNISELIGSGKDGKIVNTVQRFDSVVVASGHYHACNIPDIPGLSEWKQCFPNSIWHSKLYRSSEQFRGQTVLLIGAGVSSTDIAKDLNGVARAVYQSSRGGPYDVPSHLLPPNAARIGGIESFGPISSQKLLPDGSIPAAVTLTGGEKLCRLHQIIVCTGYHVSLPFMREKHADGVRPDEADDRVIVTNGQQYHNLHKDIWYIPDPTLAFIGVPYHVATFSLFDFQAMTLAAVFSGQIPLPSKETMAQEYRKRIEQKGAGRTFHSLKQLGAEIEYVDDLIAMVNSSADGSSPQVTGHSSKFRAAYARRRAKQDIMYSMRRDSRLDSTVLELAVGC